MISPASEKTLFESPAFRLTSHRLTQSDGAEAVLEKPNLLVINHQGRRREVPIPAPAPGGVCYTGDFPLLTAMYNLALHELEQVTTDEGLLRAGASWQGVWTRDVAYAAALGSAIAKPEETKRSLKARVHDGAVLQDTGTGGGWPVSTDRIAWAMGAWALYLTTGDMEWLAYAADVLEKTMAQDDAVLQRPMGLYPGETSFIDWREQSYPDWMGMADIGASYALGTNVLHYTARSILSRMFHALGKEDKAVANQSAATNLHQAIGHRFWSRATHSFGMMLTADGCLDERTDALATALSVLSGVAGEQGQKAMDVLPRSPYGTPVFAPYKASVPQAYHNRAIWPFVEAYVLLAYAELQDTAGVERSLACLLRAAAAFGTNKENMNAETGAACDTIQNSDRQLWSSCGMLGALYYGLFGIRYEHGDLVFSPCVPKSFGGSHWITGLRIHGMVLRVHLTGYGTEICSCMINGVPASPMIPLNTEGTLQIELALMPDDSESAPASHPEAKDDLPEPRWDAPSAEMLRWHPVPGAHSYCVFANGKALTVTAQCQHPIPPCGHGCDVYRIQAIGKDAVSCLGAPFENPAEGSVYVLQPHRIGAESEYAVLHRQAWLDTRPCTSRLDYERISLSAGTYRLRVLYSNATASKRDGDTCALRELFIDHEAQGVFLFPHNTEAGNWDDYTLSTPLTVTLESGIHCFSLRYTDRCRNSNGSLNQCMVRYLQITKED